MRRLAIRPGGVGDLILSLPALECLQADEYEIWTTARNVPLVRCADRVRSIGSTGIDLMAVSEPPAQLMQELARFDSIVSWYGSNRPDFREEVTRLGLPFTFFPALPPEASRVHATDFYLAQARLLAPCQSDGIPRINCGVSPEAPREGFAVIHPFSGGAAKNWPLENFRDLARQLEAEMPVRWCAGPEDPPLADAVTIEDLYELARWLARARLYVGNDSGITHLAAAVGTPVLALFGPTDPAIWAPRGENVQVGRFS